MVGQEKDWAGFQSREWQRANELVELMQISAPGFSSAIRFLRKDAENTSLLSAGSLFFMRRYLACPGIMAPMYYATLTYFRRAIDQKNKVSADDILRCYPPDLLAVMLACIYLNAQMRRCCDKQEWAKVGKRAQQYADLGFNFGLAVAELGPARALFMGVMQAISLGVFLYTDLKQFKDYRRKLLTQKLAEDLSEERRVWGCTHYHIAGVLAQKLGLGRDYSNSVLPMALGLDQGHLRPEAMLVRTTLNWLDALVVSGAVPQQKLGDEIDISEESANRLYQVILRFQGREESLNWLLKCSSDISEETHPQLFFEGGLGRPAGSTARAKERAAEEDLEQYKELPDDFRKLFPKDDFLSLTEEIRELARGEKD